MNEYMILIPWFILIFLVMAGSILLNNRKNRNLYLRMMRRNWGTVPTREYTPDEIAQISKFYYRFKKESEFHIDDITWNDLDMDRVFMYMNQTISSPGEEYLYYLLRTPAFSQEELDHRESMIRYFTEHEEDRLKVQSCLADIGKARKTSMGGAIYEIDQSPMVNPHNHIFHAVLAVTAIIAMLFSPVKGFAVLMGICIFNTAAYYAGADRKIVEVYLSGLQNVLQLMGAAAKMEKLPVPLLEPYQRRTKEAGKALSSFKRGSCMVTGRNAVSDGLEGILMDFVRMIFHVDLIKYNSMLKKVRGHYEEINELFCCLGELDSMLAMASFRLTLPYYCLPEYNPDADTVRTEDLYHPLISDPVSNSITAGYATLVTGSNASGKSTFLKTIAINSILAQTTNTCMSSMYRAPMVKVMTSMALSDDLAEGESYYIVEIKSLKRILDESHKETPLLCIVDEVLRGTNTIERIAASSRILSQLVQSKNVFCFAATHDIELTYILEQQFENYHFEEEIVDDQVIFNYLLQKGRATTRNAIKLLEIFDYDVKIVGDARQAAADFEATGVWKNLEGEEKVCV